MGLNSHSGVLRVRKALQERGFKPEVLELERTARSAAEAADALGIRVAQIVKSLVFVCGERPVVALVPGDRKGDPAKVARAVNAESARVAKAQEVEQATGFAPGAVAPFPLPNVETVLMDRALYHHEIVWAGAGSHKHVLGISPTDLGRLARVRPMDVVTEASYDSTDTKET